MRALLSVTDKTGIVELAKNLNSLGVELVSTGGTYKKIKENGIDVTEIDKITNFPEILEGRVKTLSPYVHGGILYMPSGLFHPVLLLPNDSLLCIHK